jgi:hypothetical protein
MLVPLRTIADRFIFSNANLKYVAANLPKGGLERVVEDPGWTVRQTMGHLAATQDEYYAWVIGRWVRDEQPVRDPNHEVHTFNAETVVRFAKTPLEDIIAALDRSLGVIVESLEGVDEAKLGDSFASWSPLEGFEAWSHHIEQHAPGLIDALPEFKRDAMVLNWVLGVDYEGNEEGREWQVRLAGEVREMFQLQGEG